MNTVTFSKEENEKFKNVLTQGLEDGTYETTIKNIKVISIVSGRNLIADFFEPQNKIIKTIFISMEPDKFIFLKPFLEKLGLSPDIEQECQKLIGKEAQIALITKTTDSGKKYQNVYLNRILSEKTILSDDVPDFDMPSDF